MVQTTGLATIMGLAGCSGGQGPSDDDSTATDTESNGGGGSDGNGGGGGSEETATETEGNAKQGGKLTVLQENSPPDFDPVKGLGISSAIIGDKFYNTLYTYDGTKFQPGDLVTGMPETERDNQRWIVELVDNATFHNGEPVTAEDVRFAHQEPLDQGTWIASDWAMAENIEVIDDNTVQFDLEFSYGPFRHSLASMHIMPKAAYQEDPEGYGVDTIIGSGPYRLEDWREGEFTRIVRWDDWWGDRTPAPNLDEVEFIPVQEPTTRVTEFKSTDAGLMANVPAKLYNTVDSINGAAVQSTPALNYGFVSFNLKEGPTRDLKVRQAIAHCVDLQDVQEKFWEPVAQRAYQPIPKPVAEDLGMPVQKWEDMAVGKDIDKAKELFDEAGLPDNYKFRTIYEPKGIIKDMIVSIANGIKEAGWDCQVVNLDRGTFLEKFTSGKESDYNFYSLDWGLGVNMDILIYNMFYIDNAGANNGHYWDDPEVMDMILEARKAPEDRRVELWTKIQTEIIQQRVQIPAFNINATWGAKDFVKDFKVTPNTETNPELTNAFGTNVWVDK